MDNDNLRGIGTFRWANNPLAKPGVLNIHIPLPEAAWEFSYAGGIQAHQCVVSSMNIG